MAHAQMRTGTGRGRGRGLGQNEQSISFGFGKAAPVSGFGTHSVVQNERRERRDEWSNNYNNNNKSNQNNGMPTNKSGNLSLDEACSRFGGFQISNDDDSASVCESMFKSEFRGGFGPAKKPEQSGSSGSSRGGFGAQAQAFGDTQSPFDGRNDHHSKHLFGSGGFNSPSSNFDDKNDTKSFGFGLGKGGGFNSPSSNFDEKNDTKSFGFGVAKGGFGSFNDGAPASSNSGFGKYSSGFGTNSTSRKIRNFDDFDDLDERPRRDFKDLVKVNKMFYVEHLEVIGQTESDVTSLRKRKNDVSITDRHSAEGGRSIPKMLWKFEHAFETYPEIMREIKEQKFAEPSPIQCQMWPVLMLGHDCIGIAQTGTGKTLAFLLPAFIHIEGQSTPRAERNGPTVLVITPTRELAQQIEREVKKYSYKDIKSVCVYGGGNRQGQIEMCSQGVEIVIATPGRLNDLVYSKYLDLTSISYLVLDEADRMLDMGFEPQIRRLLVDIRPDRQTVLTSATWPRVVRELADNYTNNGFMVVVGSLDLNACQNVEQIILVVEEEAKRQQLVDFILNMHAMDKLLVFVNRKRMAEHLSSELTRLGVTCESLHGDRDQMDRDRALKDLRRGRCRILVATDVASRGLDVPDISHVINYDFPSHIEEYVHRVGRTGRAGKNGKAITFVTRHDWRLSIELIDILEKNDQLVPDELRQMSRRFGAFLARQAESGGGSNWGNSYNKYNNNNNNNNNNSNGNYNNGRPSTRRDNMSNTFFDPFSGQKMGTFMRRN